MLVFLSSYSGWEIHYFTGFTHSKSTQILGHLWSPGETIRAYPHLPYAVENGKFHLDNRGEGWQPERFIRHCDQIANLRKPPLFITVPDQYGDATATLAMWQEWAPRLRKYRVPLAFVLQDGIELADIPKSVDVLFVGGTDRWRYPRLNDIVQLGNDRRIPVHVGRVNGNKLWVCHKAGVSSCDGSGWFKGDQQQLGKLIKYLSAQIGVDDTLHHDQLNLFSGEAEYLAYYACLPHPDARSLHTTLHSEHPLSLIKREHLVKTMQHWHSWGQVPSRQHPRKYAVRYGGRLYPVKLLISRAYSLVNPNGTPLPVYAFSGGEREANRFIESRNLQIIQVNPNVEILHPRSQSRSHPSCRVG